MNNNIRILFLRPVLNVYGASRITILLADKLKSKGYTIIFASDNQDHFKIQLEKMGIRHYTVPLRSDKKNIFRFILSFLKIALIVKREKINIIHSHHRWSTFISFFVSRLFNVYLISTYHGISEGIKKLTLWGDKIISVSEDARKHLINYYDIEPENITLIHNGIELPDNNDIKKSLDRNSHPYLPVQPFIANIARLSPEKDHESLFLAMQIVLKSYPKLMLLIVGKGPLEDRLRALATKLGIANNIKFAGEVDEVEDILIYMNFLVLPSLTEGFPITVLESFAYGKPVVATNVGDLPRIVIDGKTGFLVPPKNPMKLANSIIHLLKNRDVALEMGQKGRDLLKNKFTIEQMVQETEEVYLTQTVSKLCSS